MTNGNAKVSDVLDWCEMIFLPRSYEEYFWNISFYYTVQPALCLLPVNSNDYLRNVNNFFKMYVTTNIKVNNNLGLLILGGG